MKRILFIWALVPLIACSTSKLPTRGWVLYYADENIRGFSHIFTSIPNGKYTMYYQCDSLICNIGDSVLLHGNGKKLKLSKQ